MKNNLISILIKLVSFLLLSFNVHSSDDINDSVMQGVSDIMLMDEFSSCTDQYEINDLESNNITSSLLLSGNAFFAQGDMIIGSTNARAIVDSYDPSTNKLIYYQTAKTGFKSFSLGEKLVSKGEIVSIIKEFILDFGVPCSDLVVSIEESPEQMIFVFADSDEAIKAELAAQEMMAEIEAEMARQAALDAFQAKLAADKAAAAKSTAAYQSKRANDARIAALMDQLNTEKELAAFEAQLKAELAAQEMMAEIEAEMARQAALDAFQAKLAADKAAAAASTAAYQAKLARDERLKDKRAELKLEKELAAFEAQLEAELAAQEMMAEIEAEMARQAALDAFQAKLADEKAAAAASTAAYQSKLDYDMRVTKIMDDLIVQLDELGIIDDYKSTIKDELINEATEKLEDEKFIGTISGEIVTAAIHDFCKVNLGLSDSNIVLFKKALEGGYLGNVGPQVTDGTEFSSNRWDDYIECVGSKRK
jgi:colicin import membrane protein